MFNSIADRLVEVLDEGDMDDRSRQALAGLYRWLEQTAAVRTGAVRAPTSESVDDEKAWMETWLDHVGSKYVLTGVLSLRARNALYVARLVWLDEIDAATDEELSQVSGLGPRTLMEIREVLATYYWRGDPAASEQLWRRIANDLRLRLESHYLPENRRARVLDGIALGERVLNDAGASLTDPRTPRMID